MIEELENQRHLRSSNDIKKSTTKFTRSNTLFALFRQNSGGSILALVVGLRKVLGAFGHNAGITEWKALDFGNGPPRQGGQSECVWSQHTQGPGFAASRSLSGCIWDRTAAPAQCSLPSSAWAGIRAGQHASNKSLLKKLEIAGQKFKSNRRLKNKINSDMIK